VFVAKSVYDKDSCSWILGSSRACPRMTGEKKKATPKDDGKVGEGVFVERNVRWIAAAV
jgi:hypothetical protein